MKLSVKFVTKLNESKNLLTQRKQDNVTIITSKIKELLSTPEKENEDTRGALKKTLSLKSLFTDELRKNSHNEDHREDPSNSNIDSYKNIIIKKRIYNFCL